MTNKKQSIHKLKQKIEELTKANLTLSNNLYCYKTFAEEVLNTIGKLETEGKNISQGWITQKAVYYLIK